MYRRTHKATERRAWNPRPDAAVDEIRQEQWQPPLLRRRITIEDFDGPDPRVHVIELHRTRRIDCYRATVDGKPWRTNIGWSRILDGLRKAMPRIASQRHAG